MIATYAASTRHSMICSSAMARACAYCDRLAPSPQIHLARRSISSEVAGSRCVMVARPWRSAFMRARRLPCAVLGPVLRLAAIFLEVMSDLRKVTQRVSVVSRKSACLGCRHRRGASILGRNGILGGLQQCRTMACRIYSAPIASSLFLISGLSCRTTFNKELWTSSFPLYSINPNLRNLFMKKLTRDRVVPIISASVS